ncbi:MAG: CHAT domain-containing protein, partial [Proteobacteria bacterium]|nr:CHAT domain-containing protein [Pseudomonadota bacterium]
LVVLSSCDSARGMVKADGIQGMARAFILAGAQSVLTTLWKVPDESASVFMQFFYQYLLDGLKSSVALQKATLSVRCFAKYSQYIHWSGYQLTGRDIHFSTATTEVEKIFLRDRLGTPSVFPRLQSIKMLETVLVKNTALPTDIQVCIIRIRGAWNFTTYTFPLPRIGSHACNPHDLRCIIMYTIIIFLCYNNIL